MALRQAMVKRASDHVTRRWVHAVAGPPPLSAVIGPSPPLRLPETGFGLPGFSFLGGGMDLMAVPKKKTSPHKRGIRNGPKALKPEPVIVRCKACGRVKLQHFFCCSGIREHTEEHNK